MISCIPSQGVALNPILVVDDANAGYTAYQRASLTLDLGAGDHIALGATMKPAEPWT